MKMTFLNLRKLGLVLVAASTMAVVSCGPSAEEEAAAKEEAEAMVNDLFGGLEDAMDDAKEDAETMVEDAHEHIEGEEHAH